MGHYFLETQYKLRFIICQYQQFLYTVYKYKSYTILLYTPLDIYIICFSGCRRYQHHSTSYTSNHHSCGFCTCRLQLFLQLLDYLALPHHLGDIRSVSWSVIPLITIPSVSSSSSSFWTTWPYLTISGISGQSVG